MLELLRQDQVLMHPFIIGEIACGQMRQRALILGQLQSMTAAAIATDADALALLENSMLMGRGIGYIDVHLLASALLTGGTRIWTRDRRLAAVARDLGLAAPDSG